MILVRVPMRVSLLGGGTDLPAFYEKHTGCVVSLTINKYVYLMFSPNFQGKTIMSYSAREVVDHVHEIENTRMRLCLQRFGIEGGIEVHSYSDIPGKGSGLGSSSAFTVGMLLGAATYTGQAINKRTLAEMACDIEINKLGCPIGKQDQFAATYGGLNQFIFNRKDVEARCFTRFGMGYPPFDGMTWVNYGPGKPPLGMEIAERCMLFWTGQTRQGNDILSVQKENTEQSKIVQGLLSTMSQSAQQFSEHPSDLKWIGDELYRCWSLKRNLAAGISNKEIDEAYDAAAVAGMDGGKICGAGGGGFFLAYVPIDKQQMVQDALSPWERMQFSFEPNGAEVIYYD